MALALGVYAWWHGFQRGRQSLEFWGEEAALSIRYGEKVAIWNLVPAGELEAGGLEIDGNRFLVSTKRDISKTRGLVHARHALIEDASFVQFDPPSDCRPEWVFALHFDGRYGKATIAFDAACDQVQLLSGGRRARLTEALADAFQQKAPVWSAR